MTNEEAIKVLQEGGLVWETFPRYKPAIICAINALKNERTHGQWNEILEPFGWDDIKSAQCSACGESYPYPTDCGFDDIVEMFKYCPECGAKMEAGTRWKEEEDQP